PPRDRVAVERQSGSDDEAVELGEVDLVEVNNRRAGRRVRPRLLLGVPRGDLRTAGEQRLDGGEPRPRQAVDCIMSAGEGLGRDHLSLSVANPASASTKLMIQKRMTTVGSDQP